MERAEAFQVVKEAAVEVLGVDADVVTEEARFKEDLDADSLDLVELVMSLEEAFDITVPESAMHSFVSPHNALMWALLVRGRMARWGDFERRFPIYVYPTATTKTSAPTEQRTVART